MDEKQFAERMREYDRKLAIAKHRDYQERDLIEKLDTDMYPGFGSDHYIQKAFEKINEIVDYLNGFNPHN